MKHFLVCAGFAALFSPPFSAVAQPAMPGTPPLPAADCAVEPRSLDAVEALLAAATTALEPEFTEEPVEAELPQGPPASTEVAAAVTAVETAYVACINAGDYPRAIALVTYDTLGELVAGLGQDPKAWYSVPATPGSAAYEVNVLTVRDVRELGQDRVGAVVWWGTPGNTQYPEETLFHEFVKVDGRWLLDDETTVYYP